MPTSQARHGKPRVKIHPDDLAKLGIADGARVRMGNERGEIVLPAEAFAGVQRGVVIVESIAPNDHFEGGEGINTLTSAVSGRALRRRRLPRQPRVDREGVGYGCGHPGSWRLRLAAGIRSPSLDAGQAPPAPISDEAVKRAVRLALQSIDRALCDGFNPCAKVTPEELEHPPISIDQARSALIVGSARHWRMVRSRRQPPQRVADD